MEKKNTGLIVLVVILFLLVLGFGGFIVYDKLSSKCPITEDKEKNNQISTRTYRFFGYTVDTSPDMYTTLKLFSNNKYEFYINECEYIQKYTGQYDETKNEIVLKGNIKGSKELKFQKNTNNSSLNFDTSITCGGTEGSFDLESSVLNNYND